MFYQLYAMEDKLWAASEGRVAYLRQRGHEAPNYIKLPLNTVTSWPAAGCSFVQTIKPCQQLLPYQKRLRPVPTGFNVSARKLSPCWK